MKAYSIIRRGSIRSIGDGKDTFVFQDPGGLGRANSFVSAMPNGQTADLTVSDLWHDGRKA